MKLLTQWILLWVLYLAASQAVAHDLGVVQLILKAEGETTIHLRAKLSTKVNATPPHLPNGCAIEEQVERVTNRVTQVLEWRIRCDRGLSGTIRLSWDREGALVTVHRATGEEHSRYLAARNGDVDLELEALLGESRSGLQAAVDYLLLGIEHILIGLDHLAFVLALCLIASGWRLVKLVTAFTIGHSLTLALATLGIAQVPVQPVEVLIALSVAMMAREVVLQERENLSGQMGIHGFGLVILFGLLHGLGFASALEETGIAQGDLLIGLVSFNLGVEVGQLVFVLLVNTLFLVGGRLIEAPWLRPATAFALGSLGIFWMMERTSIFLIA